MFSVFVVLFAVFASSLVESYGFVFKTYNDSECTILEGYSYDFIPDGCVYAGLYKYRSYESMKISIDQKKKDTIIVQVYNATECGDPLPWLTYEAALNKCVDGGKITHEKFGKPKATDYYGYQYPDDDTCSKKENLGIASIHDSDECLKCDCKNYYKLYCNGTTLMKHVWQNDQCEGTPAETFIAHQKCEKSTEELDAFWKFSCEALFH